MPLKFSPACIIKQTRSNNKFTAQLPQAPSACCLFGIHAIYIIYTAPIGIYLNLYGLQYQDSTWISTNETKNWMAVAMYGNYKGFRTSWLPDKRRIFLICVEGLICVQNLRIRLRLRVLGCLTQQPSLVYHVWDPRTWYNVFMHHTCRKLIFHVFPSQQKTRRINY